LEVDWQADLEAHSQSVHSQGGEDGVLLRLFERIGVANRVFVEFGAWDGLHLSNTANLRLQHGWSGLLLEGSDRADGDLVKREHVNAENIETLFAKYDVPEEFDLLSIDIDGNDYWVWKAISRYSPRVVIVEYNVFFQPETAKTIAYDASHVWDKEHHGLYHGASLAAFDKLAREKGYALVHTEPYCPNALFVRRDLLPSDATLPSLAECTRWDWPRDGYVEPPPAPGGCWVEV
jgi:Methyltransferase FkbM domain